MSEDRIDELMAEAWELENGPAKVAILEEVVRLSDALGDIEYSIESRTELIEAATFSGQDEKSLVAFSWCLSKFDEDPDLFDDIEGLLWRYKWIVGTVAGFPRIPRSRIEQMEDDLELRLKKAGFGPAPAHQLRMENRLVMGDYEPAAEFYRKWKETPTDEMADCEACLQNQEVRYLSEMGQPAEALTLAKPLLEGRMTCEVIPEATYASVLMPMLLVGKADEAAATHLKGYRKIAGDQNYLEEVAEHLMYLVCVGNLKKGSRLFEKHLPWALGSNYGLSRLDFFLAATLLAEAISRKDGSKPIKLLLARDFPLWKEEGRYDAGELATWLRNETLQLATQFDQRNGNASKSKRIDDMTGIVKSERFVNL